MRLSPEDLADIAESVATKLQQVEVNNTKLGNPDRLGFPEQEAAQLLGLPQHVLRDARLRGEIAAKKVGKKYIYSRQTLLGYLNGVSER